MKSQGGLLTSLLQVPVDSVFQLSPVIECDTWGGSLLRGWCAFPLKEPRRGHRLVGTGGRRDQRGADWGKGRERALGRSWEFRPGNQPPSPPLNSAIVETVPFSLPFPCKHPLSCSKGVLGEITSHKFTWACLAPDLRGAGQARLFAVGAGHRLEVRSCRGLPAQAPTTEDSERRRPGARRRREAGLRWGPRPSPRTP